MKRSILIFALFIIFQVAQSQFSAQYLFPVQQGGLWGLVDKDGKVVEPFIYSEFSKGYNANNEYVVKLWDGKQMVVYTGSKAKQIYPNGFHSFEKLSDSRYASYKNGRCFLTNAKGTMVTDKSYDYVVAIPGSRYLEFSANGQNGIMDSNGIVTISKELIPMQHLGMDYFGVHEQNNYSIYRGNGEKIVSDSFVTVYIFSQKSNILMGTYKSGRTRLLDQKNNTLLMLKSRYGITTLSHDFIRIYDKKEPSQIFDVLEKKTVVTGISECQSSPFSNSVIYKKNGQFYIYHRDSIASLGQAYEDLQVQDNGIWTKNKAGLYGLLDSNFNYAIAPEYTNFTSIDDRFFGLSKSDSGFAVYNRKLLRFETPALYSNFIVGPDYLKAYYGENSLHIYDIENDALKNQMQFTGVVTQHIQRKNTTRAAPYTLVQRNQTSVGQTRWQYLKQEKNWKVILVSLDSLGRIKDTIIPPYFDSVAFSTSKYSVVMLKKSIPYTNDRGATKYRVENQFYILDHNTYLPLETPFDFVSKYEMNHRGLPTFLCIRMNGKHVLLDKETLAAGPDYTFIDEFSNNCRRAVKDGKWTRSNAAYAQPYLGNAFPKKGIIEGHWSILDSAGKEIPIEGAQEHPITMLEKFYSNQSIAVSWGKCTYVINSSGKIVIPCKYNFISRTYMNNKYIYICHNTQQAAGILEPGSKENYFRFCTSVGKLGDVMDLQDGGQRYIVDKHNQWHALPKETRPMAFYEGIGFALYRRYWRPVRSDLSYIGEESYQSVYPFKNARTIAKNGGKWGIIDTAFRWIANPQFTGTCGPVYHTSFLNSTQAGAFQFISLQGKPVPRPEGRSVPQEELAPGIFLYTKGSKYLLADSAGKTIQSDINIQRPMVIGNYIFYMKKNEWFVTSVQTHKSRNIADTFGIRNLSQQMYIWQSNIINFTPMQKELYQCKSYFTPMLRRTPALGGRWNCSLYRMGFLAGANGLFYLFSGSRLPIADFGSIRYIDSNGMVLQDNGTANLGYLSRRGLWQIPPVYEQLQLHGNGLFSCSQKTIYEFYFQDGTPIPGTWRNYSQDQEILTLYDGPKMALYNMQTMKTVWKTRE